jgi:hypothetical protein
MNKPELHLPDDTRGAVVRIKNVVIYVAATDEGVAVDLYPSYAFDTADESEASAHVLYSECEPDDEPDDES